MKPANSVCIAILLALETKSIVTCGEYNLGDCRKSLCSCSVVLRTNPKYYVKQRLFSFRVTDQACLLVKLKGFGRGIIAQRLLLKAGRLATCFVGNLALQHEFTNRVERNNAEVLQP